MAREDFRHGGGDLSDAGFWLMGYVPLTLRMGRSLGRAAGLNKLVMPAKAGIQ
jgi:hypothetical protein